VADYEDSLPRAAREELERLRECEERYWRLVEGSLHGLIIFQGDPPRPVYVSASAARIGGISVSEAEKVSSEEFLRFLHPDER